MTEDHSTNTNNESKVSTQIIDVLRMEYEELTRGTDRYSNRIFRILTGMIVTAIAIIWYSLQKPGNTEYLCFVSSMLIHAPAIYLIYNYYVYRILKSTKSIQAKRINTLLGNKSILIWEEIWNSIWSRRRGIIPSNLGWIIFFLFLITFAGICLLTSLKGATYLKTHHNQLLYGYYLFLFLLFLLEVTFTLVYMRKFHIMVKDDFKIKDL